VSTVLRPPEPRRLPLASYAEPSVTLRVGTHPSADTGPFGL